MAPPPAATSTGESSLTEGTGKHDELDELTQTIDHRTSNQTGKSVLEKTVEKILPVVSQTSQEKSLPIPPVTATTAG